jgi:hypothetical protein
MYIVFVECRGITSMEHQVYNSMVQVLPWAAEIYS